MKTPYNLEPLKEWLLQDQELIFSGPPYACVGQLHLLNQSDHKLKLRYLPMFSDKNVLECEQILCQTKLEPKAEKSIEARLDIPTQTLPGDYQIKIPIGDQTVEAQVKVLENDALNIQPRRIVIAGSPGDTITKTLRFDNLGNTDLILPARSMVWFEERDWLGHNLVQTLRDVADESNYEDYLNSLLKKFKSTMLPAITVEFDALTKKQKGKEITLKPGSFITRDVSITLPEGMLKGKTYHGFVKIQHARFWLALYCKNGGKSAENI